MRVAVESHDRFVLPSTRQSAAVDVETRSCEDGRLGYTRSGFDVRLGERVQQFDSGIYAIAESGGSPSMEWFLVKDAACLRSESLPRHSVVLLVEHKGSGVNAGRIRRGDTLGCSLGKRHS